jgi:hypothetical protein
MTRYTPGDPEVNRKQAEKQRKMGEYIQECQRNDRMRAEEIRELRDEHHPRFEARGM